MDAHWFAPKNAQAQQGEDEPLEFPNFDGGTNIFDFDVLSSNPFDSSNRSICLGPQQTRKPATSSYDAKALLNPKAAATGHPALRKDDSVEEGDGYSFARMIENQNGVQTRDDAPVRKRAAQVIIDDDDETPDHKKQKGSTFSGGGILGDHLKEERRRLDAESGNNHIDLTKEDDVVQQGEVQIQDMGNAEVLLGQFTGSANMHKIPRVSQNSMNAFGKGFWPRIKVSLHRDDSDSRNQTVTLRDGSKTEFAKLDPKTASALCPLLHASNVNGIRLKMFLQPRPKAASDFIGKSISASAKLDIFAYAPRNRSQQIGKFLSQKGIFLRQPPQEMAANYLNPQLPQDFAPTQLRPQTRTMAVQRTLEEINRETGSMLDSLAKTDDLPQMEANTSIILRPLLAHQKQALHFMMEHERDDFTDKDESPTYLLWKYKPKDNGKPSWYHVITGEEVFEKPQAIQGGILADVMGLGKTLSILALIAETREAAKQFRGQDPPSSDKLERNARGTLIVCPKSVLANWQQQIREHTTPDSIRVYQYHGPNRTQDVRELSRYDVVLTTYNTVAVEMTRARSRALASLNWFRIVLDEAHSIRTHTTQTAKGCFALSAVRRWAVTGTPVQNSLHDLGALVKFLRLTPFDDPQTWTQFIWNPLKNGQANAVEQLQILVSSITLRRAKSALEIQLPKRDERREYLTFSDSEAILYKQFASKSRNQLTRLTQNGTTLKGKAYAHVLKSIGQLRAICAHGREMLTEEDMQAIQGDDPNNAIVLDLGDEPGRDNDELISDKLAYETFSMMLESEAALCAGCGDKFPKLDKEEEEQDTDSSSEEEKDGDDIEEHEQPNIGYLTPCYHLICRKCVDFHRNEVSTAVTADQYYQCQYCDQYVRHWLFTLQRKGYERFKYARTTRSGRHEARWDENTYSGPHTKVKALLEDLRKSAEETEALPPGEPPIRSVVFSGWTSYLDLIQHALTKHDIGSTRIDGSMSVKQRTQALSTFNTIDEVTVLLVSIKAGGTGLNFTAANKAYVMEPQFNPGVEQQAVDRIHRIGQTRDVVIKHFIMNDSIEQKILTLQEKKEKLANMAVDRKRNHAEENKKRMEDLKELFK